MISSPRLYVLSLAVGAAIAAGALAGSSAASSAACLRQTPAQLRAQAKVVFDGVALDGITRSGVQRFEATRYRKGAGPAIVRVRTGWRRLADGSLSVMSEGITPRQGERWRILATGSATKTLETSLCSGSRRL